MMPAFFLVLRTLAGVAQTAGPGQGIHFQSRPDIRLVKMYPLPGTSILSPYPYLLEKALFEVSGGGLLFTKRISGRD